MSTATNPNPDTHTCYTCGYVWKHGTHGGHSCSDRLLLKLGELEARLAAAAALPSSWRQGLAREDCVEALCAKELEAALAGQGPRGTGEYHAALAAPETTPKPWGFDLWRHLHDEHHLILVESELQEIVRLAGPLVVDRVARQSLELSAKALRVMGALGCDASTTAEEAVEKVQRLLEERKHWQDGRQVGRAEALALILGTEAETFPEKYQGNMDNGDAGDCSIVWDSAALRALLGVDEAKSAWESMNDLYWQARCEILQARRNFAEESIVALEEYFRTGKTPEHRDIELLLSIALGGQRKVVADLSTGLQWLIVQCEGDSGTGSTYWDQFSEFRRAKLALAEGHAQAVLQRTVQGEWSKDAPTRAGLYWFLSGDNDGGLPITVDVLEEGPSGALYVPGFQHGWSDDRDIFHEDFQGAWWMWCPVPELPAEAFAVAEGTPAAPLTVVDGGLPESDPLRDLCDLLDEAGMKVVFWTCPKGCLGQVRWNEDKSDATCLVCGQKRSEDARVVDGQKGGASEV